MLESAEIGHRVAKDVYAREEPRLREALLLAQFELSRTRRGPVLVVVSGVDGAGRGETANALTAWMDPRHIQVVAFGERTPEEAAHPGPWRYWQALPPSGRVGIFMHAWYNESMRAPARPNRRRQTRGASGGDPRARADVERRRIGAAQVLDPSVQSRAEETPEGDRARPAPFL